MAMSDVLIIGAGPFGLSISSHLRSRGIEHTIVGRPMDTWRAHMPLGMFLKSEPYGSVISAPTKGYDIATYSKAHGFDDYVDRIGPLSIERFVGYADWFTKELVPDIRDITVTNVTPIDGGFKVEFAEESPMLVRQVIVATGLLPYQRIPSELSGLPTDLVTHSAAHRRLDPFAGKRVAVIGAGQSSLQTAALLHEAGADVQVIVRKDHLIWETALPPELTLADRIRRPPHYLCEGWGCVLYGSPDLFRMLPPNLRAHKALTTFGPKGAWWLRDRFDGIVDVLFNHQPKSVEAHGSGVRLHLDGPKQTSLDVDHVIAGTGFRIDMSLLPFLSAEILASLNTTSGCPVVNRVGESSVSGLYFAGAHSMINLGPGVRFVAGTHATSAKLASRLARRLRRGAGPVEPASPEPLAAAGAGAGAGAGSATAI
jgi:FAD-dependent urate hydroxylase